MRGYHHGSPSRMIQVARATDDLSDITVLTNGYWWHARNATGLGTAQFKVPESGLHTTFDLVQATLSKQPAQLTENNGAQFRMGKAGSAAPAVLATAGTVQAGWTGATYLAMWLRLPDAGGVITGTTQFFTHYNATGNQRRIFFITSNNADNSLDLLSSSMSTDGQAATTSTSRANSPLDTPGGWLWIEVVFDPLLTLGGSTIGDKFKFFVNMDTLVRTLDSTVDYTQIADTTAAIQAFSTSAGAANPDTTDWASCFYCNGIPSVGDRRRMAGYYPPRTITF